MCVCVRERERERKRERERDRDRDRDRETETDKAFNRDAGHTSKHDKQTKLNGKQNENNKKKSKKKTKNKFGLIYSDEQVHSQIFGKKCASNIVAGQHSRCFPTTNH